MSRFSGSERGGASDNPPRDRDPRDVRGYSDVRPRVQDSVGTELRGQRAAALLVASCPRLARDLLSVSSLRFGMFAHLLFKDKRSTTKLWV